MTRQNNPKIQTGNGTSCSKTKKIPKATECTDKRKTKAFPYDERYNIYKSLTPVAIADATPVNHLEMGVRIGTDGMPFKGGKRRKTRKNKSKKTFRKTHSKRQKGGSEDEDIALIIASRDGDIEIVRILLEKGADVNAKTDTGTTALFNAILYRHTEVVRILLENGADVHVKTMYGSTTLDMAIWYGDIEIVSMLLENGADVNAKGKYGSTALIKASENGHTEVVRMLLEKGADVNVKDDNGSTALMKASKEGRTEIVELLEKVIKTEKETRSKKQKAMELVKDRVENPASLVTQIHRGMDTYATNDYNNAVRDGIVRPPGSGRNSKLGGKSISDFFRKQKGSGVNCSSHRPCITDNIEEEYPNTIDEYLQVAIEEENASSVKTYLEEGADPNNVMITYQHQYIQGQGTETVPAIIYAARQIQPSTTILKHLIEHGASVERDVHTGSTPLIEAAEWFNLPAVRLLLNKGVDINATHVNGDIAIAYAVLNEDIDMIKLMLKKRKGEIDFNYTAYGDNNNVIDDAVENAKNPEVAKILKEYAIKQKLPKIRKRQGLRVKLGEYLQGVRGTSNRGPDGKLPDDIIRMIDRKNYLGGRSKTRKNHKKK
jgi:ankyrin repeat protein